MNTYYEVIGTYEGEVEVLYGSFIKKDCKYELDAERDGWKEEGYKALKIVSRETEDTPDQEVYKDDMINKQQLFMDQAPCFNFELDADQLLSRALEVGYVKAVEGKDDLYIVNEDY